MNRSGTAIFTLLVTVFSASVMAQSSGLVEDLKACARMTDRDARIVCYENLGERALREESAESTSSRQAAQPGAATTAQAASPQPLPDNLGKTKHGEHDNKYSAVVTRCQKGQFGDWYFFFDNGQIWKDVGNSRYNFKDCNFNVTITDDFYGFKMTIHELDESVRVKRHQ